MEKEFIPYEEALALKKLGFDEDCFGYYVDVEVANPFLVINRINDTQGGYFTLAPLYQQVFRWFREKYGLFTEFQCGDYNYYALIYKTNENGHLGKDIWCSNQINIDINELPYEEAELECLVKLLDIVKKQNLKG